MSRGALAAALALVAVAAGCATGTAKQNVPAPTASAVETAPATGAAPSSDPASSGTSTTAGKTPTPPPSSTTAASPTATTPTLPADFCTAGQLQVRVLEGGAIQGYEIAAVQFTNNSTRTCSISGIPSVRLMRGGALLVAGQPAPQQGTLMHLHPGDVAEAQIRDHSTCEAPLSDAITVAGPPGLEHLTAQRPGFEMRGCAVTVYPVGPPS